jgi:hypothetical protein
MYYRVEVHGGLAPSHCRFTLSLIHFIPYLWIDSVSLFLERRSDRTLGERRGDLRRDAGREHRRAGRRVLVRAGRRIRPVVRAGPLFRQGRARRHHPQCRGAGVVRARRPPSAPRLARRLGNDYAGGLLSLGPVLAAWASAREGGEAVDVRRLCAAAASDPLPVAALALHDLRL